MKKIIIVMCLLISTITFAQNNFKAIVKDEKTKEVLQSATANIKKLNLNSTSNEKGELTITDIPDGEFEIEFRFIGYEDYKKVFKFPFADTTEFIEIALESNAAELGEVTVQ